MSQHAEIRYRGLVAVIVCADDGGPLRRIINGRHRKPTGIFSSSKSGGHALPWESTLERDVMRLCEASPSIERMISQPHRLEMFVRGSRAPLVYIPDMEVTSSGAWATRCSQSRQFADEVLELPVIMTEGARSKTVVIEIKSKKDIRKSDPDYQNKISLAKGIYEKIGIKFVMLEEDRNLDLSKMNFLRTVLWRSRRVANHLDDAKIAQLIVRAGGCATFGEAVSALGSNAPLARSKLYDMHVRRTIAIDLLAGDDPRARIILGALSR